MLPRGSGAGTRGVAAAGIPLSAIAAPLIIASMAPVPTELTRALKSALDDRVDVMRSFTEELMRVPSENPPGRCYAECAAVIEARLRQMRLPVERIEAPEGRVIVRSSWGEGERTLWFHGHYDVVPAQSRDQFEPRWEKDNLFGRGSSDMKSGLAAMLYAVDALRAVHARPGVRVGLCFVPDEETGGRFGSHHLAALGQLGESGAGMLTPEPTGGVVWNACRGALSLRVRLKGRPIHVGHHFRGVNAFERMLPVAQALMALKNEIEERRTGWRIEPDAARRSILMLGGEAGGGDNFNVVPGQFAFTVERRFNPEEGLDAEKARLLDLLADFQRRGTELEIDLFQEAPSAGVRDDTQLGKALAASIAEVTGKPAAFEMCPGLLEIRFYAQKGMPAYAYGPGLLSVSHGPDEFVRMANVRACAEVYAATALRLGDAVER